MSRMPHKKLVVAVLAAGALATAVAGSTLATTVPDDDAASSTVAGAAFPVEIEHALGTTVIDAEPQRVVSVGLTEQDYLLAVGVTPVGVTDWYGDQPSATWPWAQDELGDAEPEVLSGSDGLQYERIAALDPDLILGLNAGLDDESYEQLSQIAPTIAHPVDAPDHFAPWRDIADLIGRAVGRSEQMDTIVTEIDAEFAAAAEANPAFDGTSIVFLQNAIYDGSAVAYQDGLSTQFLTDLGFVIPDVLDDFTEDGVSQAYIPLEQLSVLDEADVLLWATEGPGDREALEDEPLYQALVPVQEGHLVFTDGVLAGAIYFTSPLSLPFVVEHLVPALASTMAGDGPAEATPGDAALAESTGTTTAGTTAGSVPATTS